MVGDQAVHLAYVSEYHAARVELGFWVMAWFGVVAPSHARFRTHVMVDEHQTWCRDSPEALAALHVATALI